MSNDPFSSLPDLSRLDAWAAGDTEQIRRLGGVLRKTLTVSLAAARRAADQGDPSGVRRAAHDLKSAFRLAGADPLVALAETLEAIDTPELDATTLQTARRMADLGDALLSRLSEMLERES